MTIINQRWPSDLAPDVCKFTRSRNDMRQESPRTRQASVIRQGRPLWLADLSWTLPNDYRLAKLRYFLDALDGFNGSIQLWDFGADLPRGYAYGYSAPNEFIPWTYGGASVPWTSGGLNCYWSYDNMESASSPASIGDTGLTVAGFTAGALVCFQGQYVQIGRRLYVASATILANGSGVAFVSFTTPLLSTVSAGDTVRFVRAACEMQLINQNFDDSEQAGRGMITVAASFVESGQDVS